MSSKFIPVITKSRSMRVPVADVLMVERQERKITLISENSRIQYYDSMDHVLPYLDGRFYSCLQGCVINLDKVSRMENNVIYFNTGMELHLGRNNYIRTRKEYNDFLRQYSMPGDEEEIQKKNK